MKNDSPIPAAELTPGIYRHFKGNRYELLYIAAHSETLEPMAVYRALYGEKGIWVRPAAMWSELIEHDGRMVRRFEREGTEPNIKADLTEEDFRQMHALEALYYGEDHISPWQEAWAWYLEYPWYNAVMEADGRIIAFVDLFPVRDGLFEQLKAGTFNDANLSAADIADITAAKPGDGPFHMFLCCLVVDADYRGKGILSRLLRHQVEFFTQFEKKGIEIDWIITDNVTEDGCRFSEKLGFEKVTDSQFDSVINMQSYSAFAKRVMKGE